jgi:hypothetical protein
VVSLIYGGLDPDLEGDMIGLLGNFVLICTITGAVPSERNRTLILPDLIKEDSAMAWKPVELKDIPHDALYNSWNYLARILKPEACPLRHGGFNLIKDSGLKVEMKLPAEIRFNDLIRYTWTFDNREIQLTESLNELRIRVPRSGKSDMDAEFRRTFESLFMTKGIDENERPYKLRIPRLQGLKTGEAFSSNPEVKIGFASSWRDRIDGLIREECFELHFYKKIAQLMGFQKGAGWISNQLGSEASEKFRNGKGGIR